MTKKHFEAIAKILNDHSTDCDDAAENMRMSIAAQMARLFASQNPNFDRARFLKAAGVEA